MRAPPYISHLSRDKKLAKLLTLQDAFELGKRSPIHLHLCNSIMSQQLSTKVAATIRRRFLKLYSGKPSPQKILDTAYDDLRGIGLSGAKVSYIQNVARFALDHGMNHKILGKMNNEELIQHITQIKGVGRWTAEMLLMFTLGREDVFAVDDLGIQNAMIRVYKLDKTDKKKLKEDMLQISAKWSPYRTYACLHLWRHQDTIPVTG
ncbi:MAG: DNA-3-methyladenine glycosylase 2 family protein [Bacteroidota bacterium]|nr:DNA-3-methyladenine glycosylase 2 family protein [Bacteroidota bacterium]MDP4249023.1 DNA-3-methyladenine glycosylase 2 family protein [Bacteroidota bacterium]